MSDSSPVLGLTYTAFTVFGSVNVICPVTAVPFVADGSVPSSVYIVVYPGSIVIDTVLLCFHPVPVSFVIFGAPTIVLDTSGPLSLVSPLWSVTITFKKYLVPVSSPVYVYEHVPVPVFIVATSTYPPSLVVLFWNV